MRMLSIGVAVCVVIFIGFAAQAQRTVPAARGIVSGRVIDDTGAHVEGATVRLIRNNVRTRSVITDSTGTFRFADVPAATYALEVRHRSFATATQEVRVGSAAIAPITVRLIHISAARPREAADAAAQALPSTKAESRGRATGAIGDVVGSAPDTPPPAAAVPSIAGGHPRRYAPPLPYGRNTEAYDRIEDNRFRTPGKDPLSTFSIDVDTASYANVRRFLNEGTLPPPDAVRIEELINYFRFDYPQPSGSAPFSIVTEVSVAPWNTNHRLALIGLQARRVSEDRALRRNLVFLIDVSGSMMPDDKLPLVRRAMRMLVDTLTAEDRIAIVVYAGSSGLVLPTTPGSQKERIHHAIANLHAGGSTNGGDGIVLAYRMAREQFVRGGVNRVVLATDGDFNVGITDQRELVRLIEEQRESGVYLSVLGVGTGNLKDSTMERLADKGNGNYSYLDSLHEARKVLIAEAGGTLVTVAKDVKIQVEFNPAHVGAYRLIGYENRLLRDEDFNNDRKDAGDVGAGHTVTALYEIVPPGAARSRVDPLKYRATPAPSPAERSTEHANELMTVKLRYKEPDGDTSRLLTFPVVDRTSTLTNNIGFAAAVAEFGMLLRRSEDSGTATYREAAALARQHRGADETGYRAEFVRLVELAAALTRQTRPHISRR